MSNLFAAGKPAGGAALAEIAAATAGATLITLALLLLAYAHRTGRTGLLASAAGRAARLTGLPGWSALPSLFTAVPLQIALLGMYWDISLHIDVGRDPGPLANPAHYLILFGLFGIFAGGFLALVLPSAEEPAPETGVRITGEWRVPLGGVLITACGAFALIGFPLDDVWHRLFGQDVTLWGPTHLMLIGGAAMTLVGIGVLQAEGRRSRTPAMREASAGRAHRVEARFRTASMCGGLLIGLSTFQAEFDFGVPQFRLLFQPVLIALAASAALVASRYIGGRGTALGAVAFFLLLRGLVSLIVGPVLGETTPHLPLYVAEALIVEALAWRRDPAHPYAFGAGCGALIGTVGLAAEWAWSHVWMPLPWSSSLLPEAVLLGLVAGVAGGVLGAYAGVGLSRERPAWSGTARWAVPLAGLAVIATFGYGLRTTPEPGARAAIALRPAAAGTVTATVRVTPAAAARDADWLTVTAWQGGGLVVDRLVPTGRPGEYATRGPIPVTGDWKAMVRLQRGDHILAAPVFLPADPAIPARGVPARARVDRPFQVDKEVLQREAKEGVSPSLTRIGYGVVGVIALALVGLLGWGLARLSAGGPSRRPQRPAREPRIRAGAPA